MKTVSAAGMNLAGSYTHILIPMSVCSFSSILGRESQKLVLAAGDLRVMVDLPAKMEVSVLMEHLANVLSQNDEVCIKFTSQQLHRLHDYWMELHRESKRGIKSQDMYTVEILQVMYEKEQMYAYLEFTPYRAEPKELTSVQQLRQKESAVVPTVRSSGK